jgi:hypothetical protein
MRTKFTLPMLTFLQTHLRHSFHPFASSNIHHVPPAPTRLPNPKANPPSLPFIKPTKQMATYVATPDNFDEPYDAIQNAVLPFKHSSL